MKYNCFVSFLCGVMFLPVIGMVYILSLPLPSNAEELIVHNDLLHKLQEGATDVSAVMMTARDPEGRPSILKVDADGRVLCNATP